MTSKIITWTKRKWNLFFFFLLRKTKLIWNILSVGCFVYLKNNIPLMIVSFTQLFPEIFIDLFVSMLLFEFYSNWEKAFVVSIIKGEGRRIKGFYELLMFWERKKCINQWMIIVHRLCVILCLNMGT